MKHKLLPPKSDVVFKLIFGDPRNTDILADFLKAVLDLPETEYDHLVLGDPHLLPEDHEDKLGILDVKVYTTTGKIIDVEIQVLNVPELRERIMFYLSKMLTGQIKKGDSYGRIQRVISIVITDYPLILENQAYHNRYYMYDKDSGSRFTDLVEINTLELPKLPMGGDGSGLGDWLTFLRGEKEEDMEAVKEKNEYIGKAVGVLKELSEDERAQMLYESREKARWDYESGMRGAYKDGLKDGREEGRKEGLEQGLQEGIRRKALETARNFKRMGLPVAQIAEATGLAITEVEKL